VQLGRDVQKLRVVRDSVKLGEQIGPQPASQRVSEQRWRGDFLSEFKGIAREDAVWRIRTGDQRAIGGATRKEPTADALWEQRDLTGNRLPRDGKLFRARERAIAQFTPTD
jgi:hypothetical protein